MNEKSESHWGAVRMEYVIVAVFVVAAIILAVLFFGRDVMNMFGVAGQATTGAHSDAFQMQSMQENRSGHAAAERACKSFTDSKECEAAEMTQERKAAETSVRAAEVDIPQPDDDRGRGRNDVK